MAFGEVKLVMLDDLLFPPATPGAGKLVESPRKRGVTILDHNIPECGIDSVRRTLVPTHHSRRWKVGGKYTQTGIAIQGSHFPESVMDVVR